MNKWELLFIEFLNLTEFYLVKNENGTYSVRDCQGANLGDIESAEFDNAQDILDRMNIYFNDYIITDLTDECVNNVSLEYDKYEDLLKYRNDYPQYSYHFDMIDMYCNHPKDIDIDKVWDYISNNKANAMVENMVIRYSDEYTLAFVQVRYIDDDTTFATYISLHSDVDDTNDDGIFFHTDGLDGLLRLTSKDSGEDFYIVDFYGYDKAK